MSFPFSYWQQGFLNYLCPQISGKEISYNNEAQIAYADSINRVLGPNSYLTNNDEIGVFNFNLTTPILERTITGPTGNDQFAQIFYHKPSDKILTLSKDSSNNFSIAFFNPVTGFITNISISLTPMGYSPTPFFAINNLNTNIVALLVQYHGNVTIYLLDMTTNSIITSSTPSMFLPTTIVFCNITKQWAVYAGIQATGDVVIYMLNKTSLAVENTFNITSRALSAVGAGSCLLYTLSTRKLWMMGTINSSAFSQQGWWIINPNTGTTENFIPLPTNYSWGVGSTDIAPIYNATQDIIIVSAQNTFDSTWHILSYKGLNQQLLCDITNGDINEPWWFAYRQKDGLTYAQDVNGAGYLHELSP